LTRGVQADSAARIRANCEARHLASDAAAEGINLHYYCHHLVHFDIPWSLITLEQRNGRIDRYGQEHAPQIHYLLAVPASERLRGDLRVLERLVEKEHEAHKNLGDVRSLLGLQDAQAEEDHVLAGVATGQAPEQIIPDLPDIPAFHSPAGVFKGRPRVASAGQEVRDLLAHLGRALIDARAVGPAQHPAS